MFKRMLLAGAAMGMATAASAESPMAEADVSLGRVSNQYICRLDASVSPSAVRSEAGKAAGSMGQILHTYPNTIRGFAVRMPASVENRSHIAELRANNPKITGCEQDQYVRAIGRPSQSAKPGGGGGSTGQIVDEGITRVGGVGAPVSGRTAWVIDSGIDQNHPDLNVDTDRSRNFVERESSPDDLNGHGTHVAGTIGAYNNTIGSVGVAPGAPVVAVRVLNRRGSGTWAGVIAGIEYVGTTAETGDVANMSLGGGASTSVDDAVKCAADGASSGVSGCTTGGGIKFTLAAGNDEDDANNHSPARANGANIYTVSAFNAANDTMASWSNYGNPPVDYAEPGVSVYSTYKDGGYTSLSGTSMAAPHLAGILMTNSFTTDGVINGDKDSTPDAIGVRVKPAQ